MTVSHHPDITTLMAFSAGSLDEPYALVISTHLAMCEGCRAQLDRLDVIGGALLAGVEEEPVSDDALDALLGRLDEAPAEDPIRMQPRGADVPAPLARYAPEGLDALPWKGRGGGVATCELPVSPHAQSRLMLLRVGAGRAVPEHGHGGHELTLILRGSYSDRFGRFGVGDIADHDQDVEHQPIAEMGEDCICLIAVDAKLNFRSRLMKLLQPLVGI
ncbi:ChrR family anti-sigma-E factor [Pelagibacterium montanilacus]|uniref:ChrR family anti-sigma-E factor n=1 Tax=Pelagibacterium montanilacus TaxID=2185280 RepID=UPI000F8E2CE5|nr:ChrR family anti-sigma-E factor [Pelagibacterium montanilacus]